MVVLLVQFEEDDELLMKNAPDSWDWTGLAGEGDTCQVIAAGPVTELAYAL
jgi:hypothetical protein